MRTIPTLLLVFAGLAGLATTSSAQVIRGAPHQTVPDFLGYVPDEVVVVLQPEVSRQIVVTEDAATGQPRVNRATLQALLRQHTALGFQRQFPTAPFRAAGSPFPDLTGHYKLRVGPGVDLDGLVQAFEADPDVDHVEKIGMHSLYNEPNDPYYKVSPDPNFPFDQWHYWDVNSIDAELAWDNETGDPNVLVGILDSGTRYYHVDLGGNVPVWGPDNPSTAGNIFVNPGETPGNGQDDDGNGFVDDTVGWDFVSSAGGAGVKCIDDDCGGVDNDPDDTDGHGTHTGGTMAAITNNGILVSGVAGGFGAGTGVKLVPMRIGYHARFQGQVTGVVRMDWAAQAMNYMADLVDAGHNVASINCSWGSSNSGGLGAAVNNLLAHDVVIVAAAGNSNSSSPDYLGSRNDVLDVAATDINGNGASFTNHGSWVDVAAPGVQILSTYRSPDDPDPNAHYIALLDGTSMAAPHVAGIAGLLESCSPGLSGPDKFNLIVNNTDPYSDSRDLGSGIVNVAEALAATGCGTVCPVTADFNGSPTSGCDSLTVNFSDASAGPVTSWTWDFGDGSPTSGLQSPSHNYASPGTYDVTLTVGDGSCTDAVTKMGYVSVGETPVASFSGTPTSGNATLTVSFTDLSSGSPTAWTWDFGDGSPTSSAQNPSHQYTAAGTYTVTLTASNGCGSDGETKAGYITVNDPPPVTEMHVGAIVVVKENLGQGNKRGRATVTILDDNGSPVAGVTVTGDFSGKTTDNGMTSEFPTNGAGQTVLFSSSAKGGGEWCFEVTNVSGGTLTYNATENVVTQACESGPVF